ncbi:hypothetical protein JL720_2307 [Aureococcus anophagefferens]|nr:hypothetical protein JL720_2307 [Aureococcus anophagefferens]
MEAAPLIPGDANNNRADGAVDEPAPRRTRRTPPPSPRRRKLPVEYVGGSSPPQSYEYVACGVLYANAMGLCGVVLVALGSTLSTIAGRCGTTATDAGTVFLARGFGAVLGGALDVKLFEATAPLGRQRKVVVLAQLFLALVLGLMPGCTSVWVLHVLWGATGLGTATLDTGVQIATRDAQGPHAPAWHVYNTVAFAVAGAVVPLTLLLTENVAERYGVVVLLAVGNALALWFGPRLPGELDPSVTPAAKSPRSEGAHLDGRPALARAPSAQLLSRTNSGFSSSGKLPALPAGRDEQEWGAPEVLFGAICFWLLGGKVDATSYVTAYIQDSGIVADVLAPYAVLTLWLSLIAGRLIGLKGQMTLIDMRSATGAKRVARHLALWLCMGTLGVLFVAAAHTSKVNFWIGLAVYGFGNGPSIGYCYDQPAAEAAAVASAGSDASGLGGAGSSRDSLADFSEDDPQTGDDDDHDLPVYI